MTDETREPPQFADSPGLIIRSRADGTWTVYWSARAEHVKAGFRPKVLALWRGFEPTELDRHYISHHCKTMQAEMNVWARGSIIANPIGNYDGTLRTLIECYKFDADSPFQKIRYHSRQNYGYFLAKIEKDHGDVRVRDINARLLLRWHEAWVAGGKVAWAHGLVGHLRSLMTYGATLLESPECREVKVMMADMKFSQGKPRDAVLTAEMAVLIRELAHKKGHHSLALAQAIQFDGMFRQKDIIGEWVPIGEAGTSDITYREATGRDMKWLRGLRWSEIDSNLLLRHVTSKRQKEVELRLSDAPMVMEEFARLGTLPTSGPVIVSERTGRPYTAPEFRHLWRQLADECGIPKTVRNQDSRAGGITEATEAGASLEAIKHAATHSDIAMTQRYARGAAGKTAEVLNLRVAHRKNKAGT